MWEKELKAAIDAGISVIKPIMNIYCQKFKVEIKDDNSPVTLADKTADLMIRDFLKKEFPSHSFLTEESEDDLSRLKNDYVWIVDPVDGTKDFVAKDDQFTTNIGLCYQNEIVVGVIVIPARNELYFASKGNGCFYQKIGQEPIRIFANKKINNLTCLTSVFHFNQIEADLINKHKDKITKVEKAGSSLKACYIAEGKAEISYRMSSGTKEWDTAASQIIIEEAGAVMLEPNGTRIKYNRADVYNRNGYIIANLKENILL